jgi:hypothetical protein
MLLTRGFRYRLIIVFISASMSLFAPQHASAQRSKQEKEHIASTIAAEINRAITAHQKESVALRERVIGRLFQCGAIFVMMSKQLDDPETRKRIQGVAEISYDLSVRISEGVTIDRFKQIGDAAQKLVTDKFAANRTPDSEREMEMVLRNCKSFHELGTVSGAVAELLPQGVQQNAVAESAPAIEFAKELQECSLYYALLAGDLLLQVPKNSGPLSPADRDKAVRSQVYMTKSEQIEVVYKRLALLAGMTEAALTARRDTMFEQQKRIMGPQWNMGRLHERYKAFCEYMLSDTGGKARLQDVTQGNVCSGLYKCW